MPRKRYREWLGFPRHLLVKYNSFKFRFHTLGGAIVPWKRMRTFSRVTQQTEVNTSFKMTDTEQSETKIYVHRVHIFNQCCSKSMCVLCYDHMLIYIMPQAASWL